MVAQRLHRLDLRIVFLELNPKRSILTRLLYREKGVRGPAGRKGFYIIPHRKMSVV